MTRQKIGDLHGISRHKVARILHKARERGVVSIEAGDLEDHSSTLALST